jgi:hypothetical protein
MVADESCATTSVLLQACHAGSCAAALAGPATAWVEENIEETLSFYRLPRQHHKHLKSTNMWERLNEEIERRTRVMLKAACG